MKKTLTINLGGIVYHIDDDAYRLLDNYLSNLKHYFRKQEGAEEIVNDIEMRIAELFAEKVTEGKQVITVSDVEEIIARVEMCIRDRTNAPTTTVTRDMMELCSDTGNVYETVAIIGKRANPVSYTHLVRSDHCDVSRLDGIFDQINENSGRTLFDECNTPFFNTIRLTE